MIEIGHVANDDLNNYRMRLSSVRTDKYYGIFVYHFIIIHLLMR